MLNQLINTYLKWQYNLKNYVFKLQIKHFQRCHRKVLQGNGGSKTVWFDANLNQLGFETYGTSGVCKLYCYRVVIQNGPVNDFFNCQPYLGHEYKTVVVVPWFRRILGRGYVEQYVSRQQTKFETKVLSGRVTTNEFENF